MIGRTQNVSYEEIPHHRFHCFLGPRGVDHSCQHGLILCVQLMSTSRLTIFHPSQAEADERYHSPHSSIDWTSNRVCTGHNCSTLSPRASSKWSPDPPTSPRLIGVGTRVPLPVLFSASFAGNWWPWLLTRRYGSLSLVSSTRPFPPPRWLLTNG